MRIRAAQVDEVGGAVAGPVASARRRWVTRRGLVLRLRDDHGYEGWGEASPLPRYSDETLAQARACLDAVPWAELRVDDAVGDVREEVRRALEWVPSTVPSARFAMETALLDVLGQRRGWPLHRLLAPDRRVAPVPLCALVAGPEEARAALHGGYQALKCKVGAPFDTETPKVRAVRRVAGEEVTLRLDANRTWPRASWAEAVAHWAEAVAPEWIEEPVPSEDVHAALRAGIQPAVPLAADESLRTPAARTHVHACTDAGVYRAWVLKPMVLGGSLACLDLAAQAHARSAAVVVSHLFDGPLALEAARALALALGGGPAAGLASHGGLSAFPRGATPHARGARLVPPDLAGLGVRLDLEASGA